MPRFAPMMMPMTWFNCMMPEFTKPTTMTVVAEEDWMIAVTPAPSSTPLMGVEVSLSKIRSNLPPETRSSPDPMTFIPYKKSARPPNSVKIEKISMLNPLYKHFTQIHLILQK